MHVALRRPRSAQASNDRITFVSALDQRNKRGYDVLLFRPPAHTGQKAKVVTVHEGHWHELEHDIRTRKPYLGIEGLDIHKFNRESLPSDNERVPDSSDEEPTAPRPQSEDSSDNNESMQRYAPATEPEPASDISYTYHRGGPRELLLSNEHRSSIATLAKNNNRPQQIWRLRLLQLQQQQLLSNITPHQHLPLPLHRLPPHLHNELQDIYKLLYREPLEALEDLAVLGTLPDLEDQEDQEDLLLLQPPQQPRWSQCLPIVMTDSWGVYPSLTREIENLPEHSLTSWFTTSGQTHKSQD
jgi:hypothetical protein